MEMKPYSRKYSTLSRLTSVIMSVFLLIFTSIPVLASGSGEEAQQTVNVGMYLGEGYAEIDGQGHWSGIDIEITENIAQTAGFQVCFIEEDTVKQGLKDLDDGKIDMLADIAKTPEREENYLFSEHEQGSTGTNIFVKEDDTRWDYENTEQLKSMKFGCEKDNIAETDFRSWCSQYGIDPDIRLYDSGTEAADAVMNGEVDGYIDGEDYLEGFRSILSFAPSSYYFIFAKNNQELKIQVDAALGQIYIQDPLYENELMEKYLGLTQNNQTPFTDKEKEYIAQRSAVSVAVLNNDEPYFSGTVDSPKGIIPDFYSQISSVTGLTFVYQIYDNQAAAVAAVKEGRTDLVGIFSSGIVQAYDNALVITRKYTSVSTVLITDAGTDTDNIKTVAIKDRSKESLVQKMPDELKDASLLPCDTAEDCFSALSDHRADAIIIGLPSATYLVNQRNSSAYTIAPVSSVSLDLCAAAAQKDHTLISILNKGINSVSFTMDGIVANNTSANDSLKTTIAKIPAGAIAVFACVMILLVLFLLWAVFALNRSKKAKVFAVKAEAAAAEERVKAEAARKSAEEKNAFFANISHDMRTPLNAVSGFIHLAKKSDISETKRNEYLDKAEQSSNLLLNLIDDTLTMSKAGSGKLKLFPEPVDNLDMLDSIVIPIREAAAKKKISFTYDRSKLRERVILADKLNVQKIFLNLLSNAIKYTPEGGKVGLQVYLDPESGDSPDSVLIVSDNGIGISGEFLPHIFEPFTQERRHGYEAAGTGLGLSIVKTLVEMMNGTIDVKTEQNNGTIFTVRLHLDESEQKVGALSGTTDFPEITGRKVLLCEDNIFNREIAVALLKDKGLEVTAKENGKDGFQEFEESRPGTFDVILMDIRMPVMDGIEAAKAIRALDREDAKSIPIIAMTADAFSDDVKRCLDAGMNGHVAKPIEPEALFRELVTFIGKDNKENHENADQ
jgi:signal transduction histidine kinase/CheY-like chemotaxis protein